MTNPDADGKRRESEDSQNISILIHVFIFMVSKYNLVSMYLNKTLDYDIIVHYFWMYL